MIAKKTWRECSSPLISAVIAENKGKTEKEIRAALRLAYPYGERKYHPYKVWCDEVNQQLHPKPKKKIIHSPIQKSLF